MNFQQLEYIVAVKEHRHFGKAAIQCNVTQATLSGMIKKLEDELGKEIFDRSSKPIGLTESGILILNHAEKILHQKTELENSIQENITELRGNLSIGVIPTVANSLLPLLLPSLLKQHPQLNLSVKEITTEDIKKRLKTGEVDLGILATPLHDKSIDEHILYYEPMYVYGAEKSDKTFVTNKDVKDKKIWLLEEGHCFREQAITICNLQEKQVIEEQLNFQGTTFETLLNMTEHFGGFTLIPELYKQQLSASKQEKVKGFKTPVPVREISLVSYHTKTKQQSIRILSELIQELVLPILSTKDLKNSEMEIVGF